MFHGLRKQFGIDAESRNQKLVAELGISEHQYDHAKFNAYLKQHDLQQISVQKAFANAGSFKIFHNASDDFEENGVTVFKNAQGIYETDSQTLENSVQEFDTTIVTPYVAALMHATGKQIMHDVKIYISPYATAMESVATQHSQISGVITLKCNQNDKQFKF